MTTTTSPHSQTESNARAALLAAWRTERTAASSASATGDLSNQWRHLERAHILSQPLALPHVQTHFSMIASAVRRRDKREIVGQFLRLLVAAPGSWTQRYPIGNTGGADVSALLPMAIPEDLSPVIDAYNGARKSPMTVPIPKSTSFGHRIWLTTTLSLLTGLLTALLLAVVIFAGAKENVISGTVLLAFALGWVLLAALSIRLTDQPQRWAVAPAALSTFVGSVLLLWPATVTHDFLGWLWPPALLILVGWMLIQSRKRLRSRVRPMLLYPIFGVLALSALGAGYESIQETLDRDTYAMSGQLIDVGNHRLHISCTGTGSPTVVLEPGLGEPSSMMSAWIAPDVAQSTRVCVYDRAGRGWSDAAESPQDGEAVATDLHTLLERAGEKGPFVLAGHSAGGAYVQIFAHLFPGDVAGIVLLDSMHPQQYEKLPGYPTIYQNLRRGFALLPSLSRTGVGRLIGLTSASTLPASTRGEERSFLSTARHWRSVRDETAELRTTLHQAGELGGLGNTPLIVITALKGAEDGWQPLQDDLASLSTQSIHRLLPDSTHASLTDHKVDAAMSAQAIRDVVDMVRASSAATMQ